MSEQPNKSGAISRALKYFDGGGFEEELARRVAIRSESQRREGLPELHRYINEEMIPAFEEMGFETRVYQNPDPDCGPFRRAQRQETESFSKWLR